MRLSRNILAIAVMLLPFSSLFATNFYVSNSGNDSADGLTANTAWKTIAKVNAYKFSPGDQILFRRGDTWREVLTVSSSGTAANYITYGAYGSGNKPRLFGEAISCTNWTPTGTPNIWQSATVVPSDPFYISWQSDIMFETTGGLVLLGYHEDYSSNFANLTKEYRWTWNNQRIYIYSPTDPDTRYNDVEAPQHTHNVELNDHEYLAFDNLDIRYAVLSGIHDEYATVELHGLKVTNCHIAGFGSLGGPYAYGIESHHSDCYFGYNEIYSCGRRAISQNLYDTDPIVSSNIVIEHNHFHHGWHTTGVDCATSGDGQVLENITIRYNLFEGDPNQTFNNGEYPPSNHIFIAEQSPNGLGVVRNVYVYNNIFTYAHGKALIFENVKTCYAAYNTFFGFNLNLDMWQPMISCGYSTDCHLLNNIIYFNGNEDNVPQLECFFNNNSASTRPTEIDYNLWYSQDERANKVCMLEFYQSGTGGFDREYFMNTWNELRSDYGYEVHGPNPANPLFNDPQNGDFSVKTGSPAIGAAKPIDWITDDYFGNKRDPSKPTIGAVEFNSSPVEPQIPVYVSSVVENSTPSLLTMTYNLTLASIVPPASAFTVHVNSVVRNVTSVAISGSKVNLTLASPVIYGDIVTVAYTKPSTNPLQTSSGGQAVTITPQPVINNVAAIPAYVSAVVENATPSLLSMTYSLTLASIVPPTSAFTVRVNSVIRNVSSVSISGIKVNLTLTSPVLYGDVVTVAYTKPATNPLQTLSGGQAMTINPQPVINNCSATANQPPVVSISSPTKNSAFVAPATVSIEAVASDPDGTVIKVEFYNGTSKIGESTAQPYIFTWKDVQEGNYSLTAVATDNLNARTVSDPVAVVVQKSATTVNQLPSVRISSPQKGKKYKKNENIVIMVEASDPDGTISKVQLKSGSTTLTELTTEPYIFIWNDADTGSYVITAVATDNLGATSTSASLDISVVQNSEMLNLYPNPNDGHFTVAIYSQLPDNENIISVVNLAGTVVFNDQISQDEASRVLDISDCKPGTYVLFITSGKHILTTKNFIKK